MNFNIFKRKNKKQKNSGPSTALRMNIILGIILVLFLLLIGQLVYLQIIYGGRFNSEVQKTDSKVVTTNVPRGVMYDSTGKVLVGNKANNAITYTKSSTVSTEQIYSISNKLSHYITIDNEKPTKRQLYDYYLANEANNKRVEAKLPKSAKVDSNGDQLDSSTVYENTLKELEKENPKFTKRQKTAALIFNKISGAYTLSTIYIKNNHLSDKELATVG